MPEILYVEMVSITRKPIYVHRTLELRACTIKQREAEKE